MASFKEHKISYYFSILIKSPSVCLSNLLSSPAKNILSCFFLFVLQKQYLLFSPIQLFEYDFQTIDFYSTNLRSFRNATHSRLRIICLEPLL